MRDLISAEWLRRTTHSLSGDYFGGINCCFQRAVRGGGGGPAGGVGTQRAEGWRRHRDTRRPRRRRRLGRVNVSRRASLAPPSPFVAGRRAGRPVLTAAADCSRRRALGQTATNDFPCGPCQRRGLRSPAAARPRPAGAPQRAGRRGTEGAAAAVGRQSGDRVTGVVWYRLPDGIERE